MLLFFSLLFFMLFPACLIYMLPLERPAAFWKRYLTAVLFCMVVAAAFFSWLQHFDPTSPLQILYWSLRPLLVLGIAILVVRFCIRLSWSETVYCGIWIYLTREFCFDFSQIVMNFLAPDSGLYDLPFVFVTSLCHGLIYLAAFFLIARDISANGRLRCTAGQLRLAILLTALVTAVKPVATLIQNPSLEYNIFIFVQVICAFFVISALYAQNATEKRVRLERELAMHKQLWIQHEKQMESARQNAELLNFKYHDLKHYIAALRAQKDVEQRERVLDEVEESVRVFDSAVHTENEILDTVLTEKSLLCERDKIVMTCVADGTLLRNVNAVDLYVMLGNALDNAIECVAKLEDPQRRLISIAIFRIQDMVKIQIENSCDNELSFQDDLPATTKADKDSHGFGLKSIRAVAERYGGYVTVTAEDGLFTLHILLPVETAAEE